MNRYLFLDVDGVLNCDATFAANAKLSTPLVYVLDMDKVVVLRELTQRLSVRVVVSSTWRREPFGMRTLKETGLPIVGETKFMPGQPRGREIDEYLQQVRYHDDPDNKFAIIDDGGDMLAWQLPYLVQTTCEHGMTKSHVHRLEMVLTEGPKIYS